MLENLMQKLRLVLNDCEIKQFHVSRVNQEQFVGL